MNVVKGATHMVGSGDCWIISNGQGQYFSYTGYGPVEKAKTFFWKEEAVHVASLGTTTTRVCRVHRARVSVTIMDAGENTQRKIA